MTRTTRPGRPGRSVRTGPSPKRASIDHERSLAIIGAGRVGSVLARRLARTGWTIVAIAAARVDSARRLARACGARMATDDPARAMADAEIVLIAVPDREIESVVASVIAHSPRKIPGGKGAGRMGIPKTSGGHSNTGSNRVEPAKSRSRIALHTSGARGAEALSKLAARGWSVGSFHPLRSFPPRSGVDSSLEGTTIAVDGDRRALRTAKALASSLGAKTLAMPSRERARYHLAACFASNYVVTLASEASALLERSGLSKARALQALLPLLQSTLANLEETGLPRALTGPVARGDDATIARHVAVLRHAPADLRALHAHLVRRTAELARSGRMIDRSAARRIERALRKQ